MYFIELYLQEYYPNFNAIDKSKRNIIYKNN